MRSEKMLISKNYILCDFLYVTLLKNKITDRETDQRLPEL